MSDTPELIGTLDVTNALLRGILAQLERIADAVEAQVKP